MQIVHAPKKSRPNVIEAKINAIMRYKGETPKLVNERIYFSFTKIEDGKEIPYLDLDVYAKLSNSLRETIAKSPEYLEIIRKQNSKPESVIEDERPPAGYPAHFDDEIPF